MENERDDRKKMANLLGHEIRNVLANFMNASYLLRQEVQKLVALDHLSKAPKYLDIMERGINNMNSIVQDILDYSTSRMPSFVSTDIGELCRSAIEETKAPAGIKTEMKVSATLIAVVDPDELKRAVKNILKNAVQCFEENGQGVVKLTLSQDNASGSFVMEISDNGPGIDPVMMNKVTEPFFTTKSKGLGLGLTNAKRIIEERHGGKLGVSSVPGNGTTVKIELPLKR
jgi:signal transduction histidine kinase